MNKICIQSKIKRIKICIQSINNKSKQTNFLILPSPRRKNRPWESSSTRSSWCCSIYVLYQNCSYPIVVRNDTIIVHIRVIVHFWSNIKSFLEKILSCKDFDRKRKKFSPHTYTINNSRLIEQCFISLFTYIYSS